MDSRRTCPAFDLARSRRNEWCAEAKKNIPVSMDNPDDAFDWKFAVDASAWSWGAVALIRAPASSVAYGLMT